MEISMSPTTLRTIYSCWSYFEIEKRLLLPWKWNLQAGLMWKMTWSVHHHVLIIGYLCFQTTNRHNLHIYCSARCVMFLYLLDACATVAALEKLYVRWATDPLFVY